MRGRARALPFFTKPPEDRTPPPPGAVIYMDFAGLVSPSFPHGLYTTYCGAIDAGSLYGRVMAAHDDSGLCQPDPLADPVGHRIQYEIGCADQTLHC